VAHGMALDDAVSGLFSRVLSSSRGGNAWFEVANAGGRARRQFARWMFEDYPRAAPLTPWRWRSGLLHRTGAFAQAPSPHVPGQPPPAGTFPLP
jgi:hypothetical protein